MQSPTDKQPVERNKEPKRESPFELLEHMQSVTLEQAATPPEPDSQDTAKSGICFSLDQHQYVSDIEEVREVVPVPDATPLPGSKPWVKGVANVKGRLVPVIDLSIYLGLPEPEANRTRQMMVIDRKPLIAGLIVNEVHGMVHLPQGLYSEGTTKTGSREIQAVNCYLSGSYHQDQEFPVFSFNKLVNSPDFLMTAQE